MPADPNFPFTRHFASVLGSRMAYVDEGSGDPIVLLHGNPTSSYLWRGVIPHVAQVGRAIAFDMIGMGHSDKPDIAYRIYDQCEHFAGFVDTLGLEGVHLVANDWGTAVAAQYVAEHRDNVRSISFLGNIVLPWSSWENFGGQSPARVLWRAYRAPELGWDLAVNEHLFVEPALRLLLVEEPSQEVLDQYLAPYAAKESRRPVWQLANDLPIAGEPKDFYETATAYCGALAASGLPSLLLYYPAMARAVDAYRGFLKDLTAIEIPDTHHFMPEDQPDRVGEEVAGWIQGLG
jgi:haloalkane dehalogenase